MFGYKFRNYKLIDIQQQYVVVLWVVFFCYSVCLALVFQKVLLPMLPSLHAGGGLLGNDAVYFDLVARQLAEQISLNGWQAWTLYPGQGATGNVALLGGLYAIFGADPTLIIPINAAVHATGAALIYLVTCEISQKSQSGAVAGVLAATLFAIFPSALNWYGQLHKDGYAIAGFLLVLLAWLRSVSRPVDTFEFLRLLALQFLGLLLIVAVRPYGVKLMLIAHLGLGGLAFMVALLRCQLMQHIRLFGLIASSAVLMVGIAMLPASLSKADAGETALTTLSGELYSSWGHEQDWQWQRSQWLPENVDHYMEIAARTRAGLIENGLSQKAKSIIDGEVQPKSADEVLAYLPRALQIALFAPFPDAWLADLSITRLVSVGEMLVFYISFVGVVFLLCYNRGPAVFVVFYFAFFFLIVNGFTTANLGTLYRIRYAYLFVILAMGVLGWFTWLQERGLLRRAMSWLQSGASHDSVMSEAIPASAQQSRRSAVGSGMLVMALTFLAFLGFFVRDVLMANTFGIGGRLDDFFVALMVPMFLVAVISIPLGAAFTPVYLEAKERGLPQMLAAIVAKVSWRVSLGLLGICVVLAVAVPVLLPLLGMQSAVSDSRHFRQLLYCSLPILFFSGVVVLGNAILNAHGRVILTSSAQLVVPVIAVLALFVGGAEYGPLAVMVGMVIGQLANLLIIHLSLKGINLSFFNKAGVIDRGDFVSLWMQYLPLAVSALFVSLAAPVATLLSMSLPEGGVSAFNLGSKVVLFMTGLVGAAITSVMLPYFSALMAKNQLVSARRELSFFMLASTFVAVPISTGLFVWAEPIIRLMFERGGFDSDATLLVTRVMQYSVVQLPFFVCNSLLLKFATATRHVLAICVTAVIGLLVNVLLSLVLMKHMGVAGIALGSSFAVVVSTLLLIMVLLRHGHIIWTDAVIMALSWLLFLTLLISVHFQSLPSIGVTLITYAVLLAGYLRSLWDDRRASPRLAV